MSGNRYVLSPMAREDDPQEEGVQWAAALPQGPIARLDGMGPLVLDLLESCDRPLSSVELADILRAEVEGVPADAAEQIAMFLESLRTTGIVRREADV